MRKTLAFLLNVPDTEECVEWPFSIGSHGYGQIHYEGNPIGAHRLSLILHSGENPLYREAAHSCDNPLCINPKHLSWKTHLENMEDRTAAGNTVRGERNGRAKLTRLQVEAILEDTRTQKEIAETFDISRPQVSRIKRGKSWRHMN